MEHLWTGWEFWAGKGAVFLYLGMRPQVGAVSGSKISGSVPGSELPAWGHLVSQSTGNAQGPASAGGTAGRLPCLHHCPGPSGRTTSPKQAGQGPMTRGLFILCRGGGHTGNPKLCDPHPERECGRDQLTELGSGHLFISLYVSTCMHYLIMSIQPGGPGLGFQS